MKHAIWLSAIALAAFSGTAFGQTCQTCQTGQGGYAGGGYASGGYASGGYAGAGGSSGAMGFGGTTAPGLLSGGLGEQLYPYDQQDPWLHGFIQEIPAYGGFNAFRPYNYKHALSQKSLSAQWGMSPTMPYSQQFWHRYSQNVSLMGEAVGSHYAEPVAVPVLPRNPATYPAAVPAQTPFAGPRIPAFEGTPAANVSFQR